MSNIMCLIGFHKWRYCKRALWEMTHVTGSLDLCACVRCGALRHSSAEQLKLLASDGINPDRVVEFGDA